ncbi:uncharacterized protein LOC114264150 [Camellia sinensis]|uniref:uncharacterized protein LOC114264150 n=1 Tax=Camellia sinensis TaxID=4442 RepID=UPI001036780A|nr:uncharacterized protein LOC114264150 [Camellia sinensis]
MNQSHALNDDNHNDFGSVGDRIEAETGEDQDEILNLLEDVYMGTTINDDENEEDEEDGDNDKDNDDDVANNVEKEGVPNFNKLLNDAQRELYPGCRKFSLLSFVVKMLHVKVLNKWSNKSFNMLLGILKDLLPVSDQVIPWTLYEAKKFLRALGLGYVLIHVCKYDCALFWKENANLENCPICQESRYKLNYGKDMRWHKEKRVDDGILRHPADGEAWKDFDRQHPLFSQESRNVRLGLATNGFNPFRNMSNSYNMWPVIVMPYNLPPWKCMKQSFSMLSLLIPGPQAPGRDIDVYMQPLIDELKELWEDGVLTYDASIELSFQMHVAVMWTINDFPAYGNLSGWSTKGYLACPTCNKNASSQRLRGKIGYTGARHYLPDDHPWWRSRLYNDKTEFLSRPLELSGEQILEQLDSGTFKPFGKHPTNKKEKGEIYF